MKKLISHILITPTGMLAVPCSVWLGVTPENAIADDDLFSTGFGYRNALNDIYTNLASDELYGKQLNWGFLSAIFQQYNQKAGTISPMYADASELIYNTVDTEPVVTAIWEEGYKVIANLNKLIENIRPTDISLFEYGEEEKNLIYAEALSLRAMMHFDLLRLFAPATATDPSGAYLPYRDKYEAAVVEKCTVTDFIEKALKDLFEAEDILRKSDTEYRPEATYASQIYEPTPEWNAHYRFNSDSYIDDMGAFSWYRSIRFNYLASLGLKARVCIYAGSAYYKNAETTVKKLYNTYYQQRRWIGFTEGENTTCNLNFRYTKVSHDILFGLYKKQLATDYEQAVWGSSSSLSTTRLPLANIPSLFASDDMGVYTDCRFTYLIGTTSETQSKYYTLKCNPSAESVVGAMENPMIPVIRFSEICHILVEISSYNGKVTEGINYLETVRKTRGAERTLSLTVSIREQLDAEILLDIRKKMIGEGETFCTYKRMNLSTVSDSNEEGEINVTGSYVLPLPTSETTN